MKWPFIAILGIAIATTIGGYLSEAEPRCKTACAPRLVQRVSINTCECATVPPPAATPTRTPDGGAP
jgi:hypothetical protein